MSAIRAADMGDTIMSRQARAVREYAKRMEEDCGPMGPLFQAIANAVNDEEATHLGRAMLARHETLSDLAYRYGGERYPEDLWHIANILDWRP
jgi:hypothetical protein